MFRGKLVAGMAAIGLLGLPPAATGVAVPKEVFYNIKLVGVQTSTWSYNDSVNELGCVESVSGSGSERYDFSTTRVRALVRQYRGSTGIELAANKGVLIHHAIDGKSIRTLRGDCTNVTEKGDTRGCGTSTFRIELLLVEKPKAIQFIPQISKFFKCPSAATSGYNGSGGHRLETAQGKVNWNELLRSRSKRVSAELRTFHNITGIRGRVIGQERTQLSWTLTFQRVSR